MTDWSKPSLTDAYASVLTELMGRDTDALTWLIGTSSTNLPNGSVRWNATTYRWEIFNSSGGTWSAWSTQINVGTVLLGGNAAAGTLQAIPISQADARYQAAGSYAALGGNAAQVFLVANSTAATQGAVPRAQADTLYALAGSYAALGGLGTQVFLVANSAAGTQQAVPRAQADTLYQASGSYQAFLGYTPAHSGANADITSLTGLTTALSVAQGGTGVTSSTGTGSNVLSISPTFTGAPLAPTAPVGTNTTQLATTAFVLANTGGTTFGAVGTYVMATSSTLCFPGSTVSGASLIASAAGNNTSGSALSGTWKCMGLSDGSGVAGSGGTANAVSLFLRIA
ncbi:MAG TPA: hypothetical protein PLT25_02140 [Acidocella sp.]|nr:hypothetical protein [Acidocella sp.]